MASLLLAFVATGHLMAERDMAALALLHSDRANDALGLAHDKPQSSRAKGDRLLEQTDPAGLRGAAEEYLKAIHNAPCNAEHWRDWADVSRRLGRIETAEKALETAEFLAPSDHLVQMDIGALLLGENRPKEAANHHRRAIELRPSVASTIYPVYWEMDWTASETANRLLSNKPELLSRYWIDCLTWIDPGGAFDAWESLKRTHGDVFDANSKSRFFGFLIGSKAFGDAQALWENIVVDHYSAQMGGKSHAPILFWNGDFSHQPVFNGGLEWRIAERMPTATHAEIKSPNGLKQNKCLWIRFGGEENISFSNVRHSFFVEPGRTYRLKYRVRSLDITTDNGPYVGLTIFGDPSLTIKGKVVGGTGDWEFEEAFVAPESAHWGELAIFRDKSAKLNNRIKGEIWYDDFTLDVIDVGPNARDAGP